LRCFLDLCLLSLEAAGYAKRGQGWKLVQSGELGLTGKLPVMTMGGFEGSRQSAGSTGVYQV